MGELADIMIEGVEDAFYRGAAECGVQADELDDDELQALDEEVDLAITTVEDFSEEVWSGRRTVGGLLRPHINRSGLWSNQWRSAYNRAQALACENQKLAWTLGPTTDHCHDCLRLDGRVYRARVWDAWGIRPQSENLACGGWQCQCSLEPTDDPVTPGRPPDIG